MTDATMTDTQINERIARWRGWVFEDNPPSPKQWVLRLDTPAFRGIKTQGKPPDYCNSYEAMGEVLEALRADDWGVILSDDNIDGAECELNCHRGDNPPYTPERKCSLMGAPAGHLPRAVALAAIKVIEAEVTTDD